MNVMESSEARGHDGKDTDKFSVDLQVVEMSGRSGYNPTVAEFYPFPVFANHCHFSSRGTTVKTNHSLIFPHRKPTAS